ncbi:hypothetical protein [Flavobacterium lindanitolerans]|uniref:hypothetical protein n=1 Tax=Flavobacterium lindanitolerans TaxID=428988 RepID=UPI0023F39711|nr:hypothetical protein [Flavobacterium lindanitolerans]
MKIRIEDYEEVLEYLMKQRWEGGDEFVAFCDSNSPVDKQGIHTFSTAEAAAEFCYEMTTDVDRFDYIAIRMAYRLMSDAKNDLDKLMQSNGIVDIGGMVTNYLTSAKKKRNNR